MILPEKNTYQFSFQLNSEESISLMMNQPITFLFSGKCLLHRQNRNEEQNDKGNSFYNFATYTNKKYLTMLKNHGTEIKINK